MPARLDRRTFLRSGLVAPALTLLGCSRKGAGGPVEITYWEKWTKFEGEACRKTVEAFNKKHAGRIHVNLVTITQIERKLLVAIAGGNPPDVAGSYAFCIYPYADRSALVPLDEHLADAGITREDYIPVFWDMCAYRDRVWALPTTPATVALHWNKRLFGESAKELDAADLSAERAPLTIDELNRYADVLTKVDAEGNLTQVGFLPQEPGWWPWAWGHWFGGELWDGHETITADCPENVRAFEWIASYSRKHGVKNIQKFASGFGNFSSPQNAFLSGMVAMELQGVWMHNFIDMYAPGMEWGAAPFPGETAPPGVDRLDPKEAVSIADQDVIVIPRGSRHPREAWEFIRFVNSPEGMEILCMGQRKFSPLRQVSAEFWEKHPHPYITLFRDLAESPHVAYAPKTGVLREYQREMANAFDTVRNLRAEPAEALAEVRTRMQRSLDRELRHLRRRGVLDPPEA
jgi:ABC-type glycerol-3-phosphate transport system substrate-binding protein